MTWVAEEVMVEVGRVMVEVLIVHAAENKH
jgi:hypothetical protein